MLRSSRVHLKASDESNEIMSNRKPEETMAKQ